MATELEVKEAIDLGKKNAEGIAAINKSLGSLVDKLSKTPAAGHPNPASVFGNPYVRTGEDPLTSRGFSFSKMLGLLTGAVDPKEAKVEIDIHNRMHNIFVTERRDGSNFNYAGGHRPGEKAFMAPLASAFMPDQFVSREFRREMKALVMGGIEGADLDEMSSIRRKQLMARGYSTKDLSWLNELTGGSLVAPPEMGELIELLRNKEALVNAGARTVPLPPQGRMVFPRQTTPSSTYWVGENAPTIRSDIGTGQITLQAKKLAVRIHAPNELIRFASPATEALIRDDMTKSLALGLDLAGLEGQGGDNRPLGIIRRSGITTVTSSDARANGDRLVGEDIYRMVAAVEESNAEFEGWIMRPKTWFKYLQLRADAVAQGDRQGMFLFNAVREPGEMSKPMLANFPVTKSTQVSQGRVKGTGINLTYVLGGMFSDILIGMFGAIEFTATNQSDTAFINDQTWVKGILSADIAVRHEAAFSFLDNIDTTI